MAEWDDRELCPDGGCVGVIGKDGTCSVCGRAAPNWGDERQRGLRSEEEVADEVAAHVLERSLPEAPDDFDDRKLCPDGACIGVIVDGRCNVCGTAEDSAS